MAKFLFTDLHHALGDSICEATGLDPKYVRRIVLDLEVGSVGKIYVEMFADDAVLEVRIPAGGIAIKAADG